MIIHTDFYGIENVIEKLSKPHKDEVSTLCRTGGILPSTEDIKQAIKLIKAIILPGFFDADRYDVSMRGYFLGVSIEKLYKKLGEQIFRSLCFGKENINIKNKEIHEQANDITKDFINALPEIKEKLFLDFTAMYENDPAATGTGEVIFCYPGANAIIHYRIAHALLLAGVPLLPRIITEQAHSLTGIDIHPGASIGEYFSIDHGTGIVIGETCCIGKRVKLYQGVTLGAKNFKLDESGHPINIPRHPIIEDNVTIYSNATVLGRITIGHDSTIGGNVWVTESVPAYTKIVQGRPSENSI